MLAIVLLVTVGAGAALAWLRSRRGKDAQGDYAPVGRKSTSATPGAIPRATPGALTLTLTLTLTSHLSP